ncbi:MAG: glycosyltransferase family 4 protein [Hungatella sp.]|nr:glycosyltransferase family 4 protein [Hungatella sp.]
MKSTDRIKVAIVSSGYFPVPPVRGGAIESLIEILVKENDIINKLDLTVFSMYDKSAEGIARDYINSKIIFIKIPRIVQILDILIYYICKIILRKKKHMSYRYISQRLYYINEISKRIAQIDYDNLIFENHPTLLSSLKKYNNYEKYKGKYYYHAHNEITNDFGNKNYLKEVNKFICVSKFIQKSIGEYLNIQSQDRFSVLKNCVDEEKFKLRDELSVEGFRKKYKIPNDVILFAFTGRLNSEKGVKELLLGYKKAKPKNSKLIIAGSYFFGSNMKSHYEIELKFIAKDIMEEIIFTGNIPYKEMPFLYAIADVIVLPSIWNDPAPLTVIESLTCGKPLITTFSGGIPEYANSDNSILIKVNKDIIENLAQAIRELSENPEKRMALSEAAKKESMNWTKENYYKNFIREFIN